MAKKENNRKNHQARDAWKAQKKAGRPIQEWISLRPQIEGTNAARKGAHGATPIKISQAYYQGRVGA